MPGDQDQWIREAQIALGDRVRVARLQENLTQERLAERAGIDRSTIQRIERGTTDAKFSNLMRIACVLRVSVKSLLPPNA
ncbi:helix-turn-helix domain-containing protein [Streptomyces sp. NBC_00335]|uniref:helix-turn-helix domain-containing protein n=1 Tax=unclassified Streptomyces TaxID=2593676 RepID=UPI0022559854|nr:MULTISPECIES: helix-turn-helix transcriptional regulator [unclassified Streptomyces]MCX5407538.1 helix-turn-helix domain-containing protein [Streptomyces sp. NBC_00086]